MVFRSAVIVTMLAFHADAFCPLLPSNKSCGRSSCSSSSSTKGTRSTAAATGTTTTTTTTTSTRLYSTDTNLLPPELAKITAAFKSVGDDSLRHKQLLYMANQLPRIAPELMIPENKVPGCLSTVYIDGSATWNEEKGDYLIDYVGESDGLLTKGLVALLVR